MTDQEFESFRSAYQRVLVAMDEDRLMCEEAETKRMIAGLMMNVERNRALLKDIQSRRKYLESITPEALIERANHGDLASE